MKRLHAVLLTVGLWFGAVGAAATADQVEGGDITSQFRTPPDAARPWVYWFWLNGNITREGITADLEAMQRVGIGGVLIMEVDQGAPERPGGVHAGRSGGIYSSTPRRTRRLGLEVNMNNDAGWCGSGGPWITPERDAEGGLERDPVGRRPAFRGICRCRRTMRLSTATSPCWPCRRRAAN